MELKVQWLNSRKQQLINELNECQNQERDVIASLLKDNAARDKEICTMKQSFKLKEDAIKQEVSKYLVQIKTLEAIVVTKEDTIQSIKAQNTQLSSNNEERANIIQQMHTELLELKHSLVVQKEEHDKYIMNSQELLKQGQNDHNEQVLRLTKSYESRLIEQQKALSSAHQDELGEIKRNNLLLLQKIQSDYQNASSKSSENSKQVENDCTRLVAQNTKLLQVVNQLKMKSLTLQSSLNAQQQQTKILQKQIEIFKENSKRENQFLKDQRFSLIEKNRKTLEKLEEQTWTNRENQLKKEEDIKRIKKQIDKSFQQILQKSQDQAKKAQLINQELKQELLTKDQDLKQMQEISLRIKSLYENQEQEVNNLRQEVQNLRQNPKYKVEQQSLKQNEQLRAEIVRKACENQVLQDEIKRLKAKINSVANAQEEYKRNKQIMEKENKMLLSEIIFLRDKEKKGRKRDPNLSNSNFLSQMNSEQSKVYEDVEEYKKLIQFMTQEMNEVSKKVIEKDIKIEKLQGVIKRYERQLKER